MKTVTREWIEKAEGDKLVPPSGPEWEDLRPKLDALTSLGIEVRYPGVSADAEDAQEALETARIVRSLIRSFFGLHG